MRGRIQILNSIKTYLEELKQDRKRDNLMDWSNEDLEKLDRSLQNINLLFFFNSAHGKDQREKLEVAKVEEKGCSTCDLDRSKGECLEKPCINCPYWRPKEES